jgi:hypothetical protein
MFPLIREIWGSHSSECSDHGLMEAAGSSDMLAPGYQTIQGQIPQDPI